MRAKLLALAAILYSVPASAQVSIWLQKGISGYGVSVGAKRDLTHDGSAIDLSGGYSYQGWLDLDLSLITYLLPDDTFPDVDVSVYGVAPSLQVHPLKQGPGMPISVGLSAGFEYDFYSSEDFAEGAGISAYSFGGSAAVYRFIRLGERIGVTPAAILGVARGTVSFDGSSEDVSDTTVGVTLAAYLAYLDEGGRVWGLVPNVAITDDFTSIGISLGVVFSRPPD